MAGECRHAGSRHRGSRQSRLPMFATPSIALRRRGEAISSGDGVSKPDTTFPNLRRRGPLALISVSSAVPTPPLMATGWLGQLQLQALKHMLAGLSAEQAFRVLLIHHPLRSNASDQAADRLSSAAGAPEAARRRNDPARPRSRAFDHLGRRTERPDPRDRRAFRVRDRARPSSGCRVQPVCDRTRGRGLAGRAEDSRYR